MGAACTAIDDNDESKRLPQTFQLDYLISLRTAIVSGIALLALKIVGSYIEEPYLVKITLRKRKFSQIQWAGH